MPVGDLDMDLPAARDAVHRIAVSDPEHTSGAQCVVLGAGRHVIEFVTSLFFNALVGLSVRVGEDSPRGPVCQAAPASGARRPPHAIRRLSS